jgi:flagellar motor switch protein FliM
MRYTNLRGPSLFVFESKLAYAMVDSYFGGTDRPFTKIEGKEFTPIELMIMKRVMDMAIEDMEEAWEPVHKCQLEYVRTEVNPQFVGVVPPTDVIISTTFEVELENASGTIAFVVPYATIEPIKHKLSSNFQSEQDNADKLWTNTMQEHLQDASAELCVNLGETNITVSDLVNLSVGDVIPLNQDVSKELLLTVESVPKFKCFFGSSKGNRAIQITKKID